MLTDKAKQMLRYRILHPKVNRRQRCSVCGVNYLKDSPHECPPQMESAIPEWMERYRIGTPGMHGSTRGDTNMSEHPIPKDLKEAINKVWASVPYENLDDFRNAVHEALMIAARHIAALAPPLRTHKQEYCPGCHFVNRNHRRDCPARNAYARSGTPGKGEK